MFEIAEAGSTVSKADYDALTPQLRVDLINAQYDLSGAGFPVVILLVGDDRIGCDEVINLLNAWLDARQIDTHVFERPTAEERERPRFWRYWRMLPPAGRIALFRGGWALSVISDFAEGRIDEAHFNARLDHIRQFEKALVDDGALILKFWLHLPRDERKKQLKKARKDPSRPRIPDEADWTILERFDQVEPIVQRFLRETSTAETAWEIVEGTDHRHRNLTVARRLLNALVERLNYPRGATLGATLAPGHDGKPSPRIGDGLSHPADADILGTVDLSATMPYEAYRPTLEQQQGRLGRLSRKARLRGISSVIVFEGWDTAGKGGVIRRLTAAMDAADYRVVSVSAPTPEEKSHHYLWRFWRQLPRAGRMLIFDRSWYGRVLVERVEGFARDDEWRRAYAEINDFEEQFIEHGTPVFKFWLHIDPDEQARRLEARAQTPYKKYKLTEEDLRNREKWPAYTVAANEMIARTSTEIAPWHLVAANDKRHARVEVLRTLCDGLKQAIKAGS